MELRNLTNEEIDEKIQELQLQWDPISAAIKPFKQEKNRRELEKYVGKYFLETSSSSKTYRHVLTARVGEYGLDDVMVDSIYFGKDYIGISRNQEELNYRYTCEKEIGEQEWNAAVLRAKDFMEGM